MSEEAKRERPAEVTVPRDVLERALEALEDKEENEFSQTRRVLDIAILHRILR